MADLPKERLTSGDPPFTHVGVSYFGPLYVGQGCTHAKRYGCLFTCLAIRAAHIEIVHSLNTDGFLNALQRFVNLRGNPTTIYSANVTNFHAGGREVCESLEQLNQRPIHKFLCRRNIIWKFNPPGASHMGGVWERVIRSIRKILRALLGDQLVSDEMLLTLMAEVQGILNGRPLTPVSSDLRDLEPLTPNHLLLLKANPNLSPCISSKDDLYSRCRWRQVRYLSDIIILEMLVKRVFADSSGEREMVQTTLPFGCRRCSANRGRKCSSREMAVRNRDRSVPRKRWFHQIG